MIKAAFELVGDPQNRVIYDLENSIENDYTKYNYSNRMKYNIGTKNLYSHYDDKWSNFKAPDWSDPYKGEDFRSEYIKIKETRMYDSVISPKTVKFNQILIDYRVGLLFFLIFSIDIFYLNPTFFKQWLVYNQIKQVLSIKETN